MTLIAGLFASFIGKWGSKLLALMGVATAALAAAAWLEHRGYDHGYADRDAIVQKQLVRQAEANAAQLQRNIADAATRDAAVMQALGLERDKNATATEQLRKQLAAEEAKWKRENPHATPSPLAACTVDPESVRVLNRALAGAPAKPAAGRASGVAAQASGPAAAASAPADVTGADLAQHDLMVQGAYNQLAIQLNALIDWVQAQLQTNGASK